MSGNGSNRHCILFTGHRIDATSRASPRFPASAESGARNLIQQAVFAEVSKNGAGNLHAISSGANGGDILFLETCADQRIHAELYLALPHDQFVRASVADAGETWVQRFESLCRRFTSHVLPANDDSPLNVYQRTNLWMLETALESFGSNTTVMALWDGQPGDGDGGTSDMIARARRAGADVVHLDVSDIR